LNSSQAHKSSDEVIDKQITKSPNLLNSETSNKLKYLAMARVYSKNSTERDPEDRHSTGDIG
jgi:hypothetical protein